MEFKNFFDRDLKKLTFWNEFWLADFCSERARPEVICFQINGPEKIIGLNQCREK